MAAGSSGRSSQHGVGTARTLDAAASGISAPASHDPMALALSPSVDSRGAPWLGDSALSPSTPEPRLSQHAVFSVGGHNLASSLKEGTLEAEEE